MKITFLRLDLKIATGVKREFNFVRTFKYSIQRGYSRNYRKLEIKKNLLLLSIFLRVYTESNPRF